MSACILARTWLTVPGAESMASVQSVWIESITMKSGGGPCSMVAKMRSTQVSATRPSGAFERPKARSSEANLIGGFFTGKIKRANGPGATWSRRPAAGAWICRCQARRSRAPPTLARSRRRRRGPIRRCRLKCGADILALGVKALYRGGFRSPLNLLRYRPGAGKNAASWDRLFHSPQDGHFPCHLLAMAPQDWQT